MIGLPIYVVLLASVIVLEFLGSCSIFVFDMVFRCLGNLLCEIYASL